MVPCVGVRHSLCACTNISTQSTAAPCVNATLWFTCGRPTLTPPDTRIARLVVAPARRGGISSYRLALFSGAALVFAATGGARLPSTRSVLWDSSLLRLPPSAFSPLALAAACPKHATNSWKSTAPSPSVSAASKTCPPCHSNPRRRSIALSSARSMPPEPSRSKRSNADRSAAAELSCNGRTIATNSSKERVPCPYAPGARTASL